MPLSPPLWGGWPSASEVGRGIKKLPFYCRSGNFVLRTDLFRQPVRAATFPGGEGMGRAVYNIFPIIRFIPQLPTTFSEKYWIPAANYDRI